MIDQLNLTPNPQKSVLTCYPSGYQKDDPLEKQETIDSTPLCMVFTHFDENNLVRFKSTKLVNHNEELQNPYLSLFWAAGFSFSFGQLVKDCPYRSDLEQVFFGEEQFQMY